MGSGASKDVPGPKGKPEPKDKPVSKSESNSPKKVNISPSKSSKGENEKLHWSPSIDSDLEQDGEDLQALQGELDQALVGHNRALSASNDQKGVHDPTQTFKPRYISDWQMPEHLARQEQELLNVYNTTQHGIPNSNKRVQNGDSRLYHRDVPNGIHTQSQPAATTGTWELEGPPVRNGFDPAKFKAANVNNKVQRSDEKAIYQGYKIEDSYHGDDVSQTPREQENRNAPRMSPHPPSRKSKGSFHYDVSEEELMANIEHEFDL